MWTCSALRLTSSSEAFLSQRDERRREKKCIPIRKTKKNRVPDRPSHLSSSPHHWPLSSSQYANEHVMFQLPDRPLLLMHGGHFVPRWLAIGSRRPALARRCWFCCWSGLSVTTGQQQRGKRGEDRGGGPAVPTSALPNQRRRWDGPDSTTQNRTRLERTRYARNLCWFQCSVWGFAASLRQ